MNTLSRTLALLFGAIGLSSLLVACPPPDRSDVNDDDDNGGDDDDATADDDSASGDDDTPSDDDSQASSACEQYIDAVVGCYADYGIDYSEYYDVSSACDGDDGSIDAYYQCATQILNDADCSDETGLSEAFTDMSAECGFEAQ